MKNIFFTLSILFVLYSCKTTKTYIGDYDLCKREIIQIIDNPNINNGGIICYFDRETPEMPMPNVYLFDKNGKQYDAVSCYDMLPHFAECIIRYGKDSLSRSALLSTVVRDDKSKTVWRTNLNRFLKKTEYQTYGWYFIRKRKIA